MPASSEISMVKGGNGYPTEAKHDQAVLATFPADTQTSRDRLLWQS